eukprot:7145429-Pyramimonas_sp.AAC.1
MLNGEKQWSNFDSRREVFFWVEDPGPRIALLRDIGIDAVDFQDAHHGNEGIEHPEGNVHPGR